MGGLLLFTRFTPMAPKKKNHSHTQAAIISSWLVIPGWLYHLVMTNIAMGKSTHF